MKAESSSQSGVRAPRILGRYALYEAIASGGMATVHLGRQMGAAGFARTVAIKRLHVHLARDPSFVAMFVDEARLVARIRHPNVVPTLDVANVDDELFVVMDYVHGESLAHLLKLGRKSAEPLPPELCVHVLAEALQGLHAAHEAKSERGDPLRIVHRDVSPHNVFVGADGITRVLDFGVAKALGRMQASADGEIKGKVAYASPEQLRGQPVTRTSDIYSAGIVLWEMLAGRKLFEGEHEAAVLMAAIGAEIPPLATVAPDVSPALAAAVMRALARDPSARFATAAEMAAALEQTVPAVSTREVAAWVQRVAKDNLDRRAKQVERVEGLSISGMHAAAPLSAPLDLEDALPPEPPARPSTTASSRTSRTAVSSAIEMDVDFGRGRSRRLVVATVCVLGGVGGAVFALALSGPPQAALPEPANAPVEVAPPAPAATATATAAASASAPAAASARPPTRPARGAPARPRPADAPPPAAEDPDDLYGRR